MESPAYPAALAPPDGVAPLPRRLRGFLDGAAIFDTLEAVYVWDVPYYPYYYVPAAAVDPEALAQLGQSAKGAGEEGHNGPEGTVRIEWEALEAWFEEDEQVFVHPRNPYSRVDALRSARPARIEIDGLVLADAATTVMVFETGLPPRRYFERTAVRFDRLHSSDTVTECPYKGTTSRYWAFGEGEGRRDLAWSYEFPVPALGAIAGLVAFFDERVDTFVEGEPVERPRTPFSD